MRLITLSGALNNVNQIGEFRGMLPQEILKLRSSEIAGNVYFSIHCCIFSVFKKGNQATWKGVLWPCL